MTGIDMKHVPYRGGGQAINDVVAGHVPVYFADVGPAAALIKAGKLTALGVTTATRTGNLPDVPTLERGRRHRLRGQHLADDRRAGRTCRSRSWPSSTPRSSTSCRRRRRRQHFISLGMQPTTSTPQQAQDYIDVEAARWTKIIKGIGVSMD